MFPFSPSVIDLIHVLVNSYKSFHQHKSMIPYTIDTLQFPLSVVQATWLRSSLCPYCPLHCTQDIPKLHTHLYKERFQLGKKVENAEWSPSFSCPGNSIIKSQSSWMWFLETNLPRYRPGCHTDNHGNLANFRY